MPDRTSYRPGTPNWVDLQTTDQEAAKSFYGRLFGWTFDDRPMPQGQVYSMAVHNGGVVAAIAPGDAPVWNTYLAVDDIDAAAARIEPAGGKVLMPVFPVMDAGRMCFAADPTGATVALWQADEHIGATVVNEPGALIWNELVTDDPDGALPFYEQVFGITARKGSLGDRPYTSLFVEDAPVAGSLSGSPSRWTVCFDVHDTAETVKLATELGGSVVVEPFDTPIGAVAALRDPQGGEFGVIAHHPPEQ
jgi:predicted enzyme related to lactoylglutathione lyase